MNIFKQIYILILNILIELKEQKLLNNIITDFIVAPPNNRLYGEIYTNVAFILAKHEKKSAVEIAKILVNKIQCCQKISKVDIAYPGFINIQLKRTVWYDLLNSINTLKKEFGSLNIGKNETVNLEFLSANPTGPLHIGHARGAVFGDVLANLMKKVGYKVIKEYFINDAGAQINLLLQTVYLRYQEALGEKIILDNSVYTGEYLKSIGESLARKYGNTLINTPHHQIFRTYTLNKILESIKEEMHLLGISHDVFTSEDEIQKSGKIEESLRILSDKGLIYKGNLKQPKGKLTNTWIPRRELMFRASKFGDDIDRALKKQDGHWTYFASDIAYHFDKISRGFKKIVVALGSDHTGYAKRLQGVVSALSNNTVKIDIKIHNVVQFFEHGKPIKMSKRSGHFLTVQDVVEEVGKDATRFIMLTRSHDMVLDFDFDKVKEQSKDNPIFYVQYAYARAFSLINKSPKNLPSPDLSLLINELELLLIQSLAKWPLILENSAIQCEPHKVTFYLIEIAEIFHSLWGCGQNNIHMRMILYDNLLLTAARIFLVQAFLYILADGLDIMNITPLEEMK
ncbi:arginine--tRNA ligase [Wolbachia endosymbiont of Howardula sp.]|uniref:arginine--tRNA ligase n=1 Tax=Wolbachia endosymbiont of Howardula sp. TaxID=2916816 RepID=UPI00217E8E45|nr:arginine--tRNA ligase [Wolbachia endosymbiont of Howardula sp.]UWI83070.1 arginine--tRNA ligase [Wolbachia endosymbiont of Howardula sp.]